MALKAQVKGDTKNIAISEGSLDFDQSKLNFSLDAKNFDKPDVTFDLSLDQIDLDAYLPPSSKSKTQIEKKPGAAGPNKEKVDYAPLRKLALEGKIRALALKVRGTQVQDLNLSVSGKDGFFRTQISIYHHERCFQHPQHDHDVTCPACSGHRKSGSSQRDS